MQKIYTFHTTAFGTVTADSEEAAREALKLVAEKSSDQIVLMDGKQLKDGGYIHAVLAVSPQVELTYYRDND